MKRKFYPLYKNPIVGFMQESGLNVRSLALVTGLKESTIRNVLCGNVRRLPKNLKKYIASMGYSPRKLAYTYYVWQKTMIWRDTVELQYELMWNKWFYHIRYMTHSIEKTWKNKSKNYGFTKELGEILRRWGKYVERRHAEENIKSV